MSKIIFSVFILLCFCSTMVFAVTDGELFLALPYELKVVYCWGFLNGNFTTIQIVTERLGEEFPALCTLLSWAQVMIPAEELCQELISYFKKNPDSDVSLHSATMLIAMALYSKEEVSRNGS